MIPKINPDELVLELIGDDERGYDFITEQDILALKALSSEQGVLTLYLDIRPERLQREPLMLRFKNLTAPVRERISDRNALLLFDAVIADVGRRLEHNYSRPRGRGLAIFAAPSKFSPKGDRHVKYQIFLDYHLPEAPQDLMTWGAAPALTPLLIQLDEHEPAGIVLVDRRRARFFVYYMGEAAEYNIVEVDETPAKTKALGWRFITSNGRRSIIVSISAMWPLWRISSPAKLAGNGWRWPGPMRLRLSWPIISPRLCSRSCWATFPCL